MNFEKIKHFKINSKFDFIFGYQANSWTSISSDEVLHWKRVPLLYEQVKFELESFNTLGILEYIEEPEIGDECYFWNIADKMMDSTVDGKPFIGILSNINDDRYEVVDCDMTFRFAKKV
jgi:hypothetical protein